MNRSRSLLSYCAVLVFCCVLGGVADAQSPSEPTSQPADAEVARAGSPWDRISPVASFFTRFETGIDDAAPDPRLLYRARFGFHAPTLFDGDHFDVGARFVPQVTGDWLSPFVGDAAGPLFGLFEGAMLINGPRYELTIGRFDLHYGDQRVIGRRNWRPEGQSFNGVRFHFVERYYYFADAILTLPDDEDGRMLLWGFYGGLDRAQGPRNSFDFYTLARTWTGRETATPAGTTEVTIGLRDNSIKFDPVDYSGDVAVQLGRRPGAGASTRSVLAYHFDMQVGVTLGGGYGEGPVRLALEGVLASGDNPETADDEGWEAPYAGRHFHLGLANRVARADLVGAAARIDLKLGRATRIDLAGWGFWRARSAGDDKFIGWEADIGLSQPLIGPLGIRAEYTLFSDGDTYDNVVLVRLGFDVN